MNSNSFKEAKISLYILSAIIVISLVFYFVASMFTSMGYDGREKAKDANAVVEKKEGVVIVIDAGHGGEDPGAISDELLEKDLNLDVALELDRLLTSFGYNTVLTRTEDVLLYRSGEESKKKLYDLKNRADIAESYEDSVFVSIHMNKFPLSYCKGLQTFYSENNELSKVLADSIQENARILQTDNDRTVKSGNDTIYLLNTLDMPAILIECGFLSNEEEADLLSDEQYRKALAFSIYCGLAEVLEENNL